MNVPPSWPARDVRVVRRSELLQVWFIEGSGGECYGRLDVDCADRGATGAAKSSA